MRHSPDTTASVSIYLTAEELGKAFANRSDDDQVEILRAIVKGFDNAQQAEMQACYIGKRLFGESGKDGTFEAVGFLRMILYSCREDAKDMVNAATVPGETT
jgi:hypothetical protein